MASTKVEKLVNLCEHIHVSTHVIFLRVGAADLRRLALYIMADTPILSPLGALGELLSFN